MHITKQINIITYLIKTGCSPHCVMLMLVCLMPVPMSSSFEQHSIPEMMLLHYHFLHLLTHQDVELTHCWSWEVQVLKAGEQLAEEPSVTWTVLGQLYTEQQEQLVMLAAEEAVIAPETTENKRIGLIGHFQGDGTQIK